MKSGSVFHTASNTRQRGYKLPTRTVKEAVGDLTVASYPGVSGGYGYEAAATDQMWVPSGNVWYPMPAASVELSERMLTK